MIAGVAWAAAFLGFVQRAQDGPEVYPCAHRPDRIHKRKPRPVMPFLAEVEGVRKARQACMHGTIADEQDGVGIDAFGALIQRERSYLRFHPIAMVQEDLGQRGAGARALIQGDAADTGPGDPAK